MATNENHTCDVTKPTLDALWPVGNTPEGIGHLAEWGGAAISAPIVKNADAGGDISCGGVVRGVEMQGGLTTVSVSVRRCIDTGDDTLEPSLLIDFGAEDVPSAGVLQLAGGDRTGDTPAAVGDVAPEHTNGNATQHTSNGESHSDHCTATVNFVSPPAEHVLQNLTDESSTAVLDISSDITDDDELDAVHPRLKRPSSASRLPVSRLDPRFICGTCRHDTLQWTDCVDHAYRLRHGLAERCLLCRLPAVTCRRRGQLGTWHRCHVVDVVRQMGAKAIGALVDGSHLTVLRPWEICCGQCVDAFGASTAKLVQHCIERAHAVRRHCARCLFPVMGYTLNGGCRELHVCVGGKQWLTAEECELLESLDSGSESGRSVDVEQVIQVCDGRSVSERAASDQNVMMRSNGTDGDLPVPDSNNYCSSLSSSNGRHTTSSEESGKSSKNLEPSSISGNASNNHTPLQSTRSGSKRNLSSDEASPSDRIRFCPTSEDHLPNSVQTDYLKVENGDCAVGANGSSGIGPVVLPKT